MKENHFVPLRNYTTLKPAIRIRSRRRCFDLYEITLLSNGDKVVEFSVLVLYLYEITLLSNYMIVILDC